MPISIKRALFNWATFQKGLVKCSFCVLFSS